MSWLSKLLNKLFKLREKSDGDVVKPFLDHMEDLRWTLIKMIAVLAVGMIGSFTFCKQLTQLLELPLQVVGENGKLPLMVTSITESFMISLSLSFYAGIVVTFPFLLYFLAEFILPALTRQEKKYLLPAIGVGFVLFGLGVVACFKFILPQTLKFFYEYGKAMGVENRWQARDYFSFVTQLCIAFGLLCELPVAVLTLAALGFISFEWLHKTRAYAIVIILVLALIVAPTPDPMTWFSMSAPVLLLYEMCIWLVWLLERRRGKQPTLSE